MRSRTVWSGHIRSQWWTCSNKPASAIVRLRPDFQVESFNVRRCHHPVGRASKRSKRKFWGCPQRQQGGVLRNAQPRQVLPEQAVCSDELLLGCSAERSFRWKGLRQSSSPIRWHRRSPPGTSRSDAFSRSYQSCITFIVKHLSLVSRPLSKWFEFRSWTLVFEQVYELIQRRSA